MLAINPELQSELLRRASLLAALGHSNAAIADYEKVLELNDDMNLQQEIRDRLRELQSKSEHLH